jgi:hypothetical protein
LNWHRNVLGSLTLNRCLIWGGWMPSINLINRY